MKTCFVRGAVVGALVLILLVAFCGVLPVSATSMNNEDISTFTLNDVGVTVKKVMLGELVVYVGEIITSLYTEDFKLASITMNGVKKTSAFVHIVGEDFEISEVSAKTESDSGSTVYSLTTYANQSGSYSVKVSASTSNGVTVGYIIQDMFAPVGKCSFNFTSLSGENYKVWVTLPTGETIDPTMYQFVDDWHGPWWAPYNLKGWMIIWTSSEQVGIDVVAALLGLIVGGIFLGAIGLVLAVSGMYVATDGCLHSYWDVILLYGFIPIYNEAGYYTNQIWPDQHLGIWWFIPVTPAGAPWHITVWPWGW